MMKLALFINCCIPRIDIRFAITLQRIQNLKRSRDFFLRTHSHIYSIFEIKKVPQKVFFTLLFVYSKAWATADSESVQTSRNVHWELGWNRDRIIYVGKVRKREIATI